MSSDPKFTVLDFTKYVTKFRHLNCLFTFASHEMGCHRKNKIALNVLIISIACLKTYTNCHSLLVYKQLLSFKIIAISS